MHENSLRADLVLAGGGVKGIGHVGAVGALRAGGYTFPRVAGTSAGSIVGALVAAGADSQHLLEVIQSLDWEQFVDPSLFDRIPLIGPAASILFENGFFEGRYFYDWIKDELANLGVTTFADLRRDDVDGSAPIEQAYKLVVMATDITRGELVRLPWDYPRYGLNPDEQLVADAVRASISIPLFFEPVHLVDADGMTSTLVDGGALSNYPIDVFDRTDGIPPQWPTFGVSLLPRLPEANVQIFPLLGPLRRRGLPHYLECLITTTVVGRDQAHLSKPWVQARTIQVDTSSVGVVEFDIDDAGERGLYEQGSAAARRFLDGWDFEAYTRRFRPSVAVASVR